MRRQRLFLLIIVLALVSGVSSAQIPDPLRVSFIPDLFPVSFTNENGEPDGAFPRVVRAVAEENGIEIEWVEGTWGENMERGRAGELDLMIALIRTEERAAFLDFNRETVISSWSQVFQGREGMVENIFDLENKRIGLVFNDQNAQGFVALASSFDINFNSVYFDTFQEVAAELKNGGVDAGVFFSLFHLSEPDLIPTSVIFQPNSSFFAVPKGRDMTILDLIDDTLWEWKEDENSFYYTDVVALMTPRSGEVPRWFRLLLFGLSGIALIAVFFILALRREVNLRTAELLASQSVYRRTFMDSVVGIVHLDDTGRILRVNPAFCDFLGFPEKEMVGANLQQFVHPDDRDQEERIAAAMASTESRSFQVNVRFYNSDGGIVWGSVSISEIRSEEDDVLFYVILVEDITKTKMAESKLGDLEGRFAAMFQNSYQMTAVLDELGRLLDVNDTLKKAFNLSSNIRNYIGKTMDEMDWMGPVVSLRMQEMVDECLSTGRTIRHTISSEETESRRALDLTIKPVVDSAGSIRYCIVEAHDVTELMTLTGNLEKQVEERTNEFRMAQNQLIEAEKMASLGRLVAGVAHEINTPVGVAKTGVSYLAEQITETRRQFEEKNLTEESFRSALDSFDDLSRILEGNLDRAIKLIRDFKLTSADQASDEIRKVNIREYLTAVIHTVTPRLKRAGIVWNIDAPDEEHNLHVGAINPILVNLAINSISHAFSEEAGAIDVVHRVIDGRHVLTFSDNGRGIDPQLIPRLFEPFYTTERAKGFTGLGLNIVYNLVKDIMNGDITCESRLGSGTTFRIEYPNPEI